MRTHAPWFGLLLVASLGCESVLGLDEFRDRPAGTGASAGSGADANGGSTTTQGGTGGVPSSGGMGGGAGGNGGTAGGGGETTPAKRVFVTSVAYQGYSIIGLGSADAFCDARADVQTQNHGPFRAWISDDNENAVLRLMNGGPWYLVDVDFQPSNQLVAANPGELTDDGPTHAIIVHEYGATLPNTAQAWTGTDQTGNATAVDCSGWTGMLSEPTGTVGNAGDLGFTWTNVATLSCNSEAHLYCFEM